VRVNNLPRFATQWNSGMTRESNMGPLLPIPSVLATKPLSHTILKFELHLQAFASNLARKHYEHRLGQKVWAAWHSVVESRWQQRVEKACQTRAEQVCIELTNDYETKLTSVCICQWSRHSYLHCILLENPCSVMAVVIESQDWHPACKICNCLNYCLGLDWSLYSVS